MFKRLFGPKWQHPNPEVRLTAVKTIDDDSLLEEILFCDDDPLVLQQALENLYDPNVLKKVACSHPNLAIRRNAIGRVHEKEYFALALTEPSWEICQILLQKIRSDKELTRLAIEAVNTKLQVAAAQEVKDHKYFTTLATEAANAEVRTTARSKLERFRHATKTTYYVFVETQKCWSCGAPPAHKKNRPIKQWTCKKCGNGTIITDETWKKNLKRSQKSAKPKCYACGKAISFPMHSGDSTVFSCTCGAKYLISKAPHWLTQLSELKYGNRIDQICLFDYPSPKQNPPKDTRSGFNCTECDAPLKLTKSISHMHTCVFCNASQYISIAPAEKNAPLINKWFFRLSLPD